VTDVWANYIERRAQVLPVRGEERFSGAQWAAKEQVEFFIRWDPDVANVSPLDRVIYPTNEPVTEAQIYEVMAVHEIDRHDGLRIMTARKAELVP